MCFHWRTFLSGCFHIMGANHAKLQDLYDMCHGFLEVSRLADVHFHPNLIQTWLKHSVIEHEPPPPRASLVAMCESHVRECNNSPARISLNHIDNIHNVNISGMDSQSKHLHSFCVWLATSSCNFSALFSRLSCLHVVQEKIKQLVPEICISVWVVVSHNNIITVATSRNRYFLRCFDVFS